MEKSSPGTQYITCPSRNIPTCVIDRQINISHNTRFRSDFLKLQLRSLRYTDLKMFRLPRGKVSIENRNLSFSCNFVSPTIDSIACSWTAGVYPKQYVFIGMLSKAQGKIITERSDSGCPLYSQETNFNYLWKNRRVTDITHMDDNANHVKSFFIVSQRMDEYICDIELVPRTYNFSVVQTYPQPVVELEYKVYNLVWNANVQKVSVGTEVGIMLDAFDSFFPDYSQPFSPGGDLQRFALPFVQRFDSSGNVLYFGFDDGHLTCLDMRSSHLNFQYDIPIGQGVTGLQLLQDGVTKIVGCKNDKLCCVDTRMKSVLFDYPHHRTNGEMTAFYLDESMELLCSSGRDHVTRLWDLKRGNLLNEVPVSFPVEKAAYMYSMVRSLGRRLYSYTFCGDKVLHGKNFPKY